MDRISADGIRYAFLFVLFRSSEADYFFLILLVELEREDEREEEMRDEEDLEMREGDVLLKDRDEEELLDAEKPEEEDLILGEPSLTWGEDRLDDE